MRYVVAEAARRPGFDANPLCPWQRIQDFVLLIVSDIHFGKGAPTAERKKEVELTALLEAERERLDAIYLLGDVFDQYVEYRHLVPKGFARFQGALALLTDRDVPVNYVVGNHDPWHLDYFKRELGVNIHDRAVAVEAYGRIVVLAHGDTAVASPSSSWMRRLIRHSASFALFRTLLPADPAYRLTRWTKDRFASAPLDPETVRKLKDHAGQRISGGADVVILGHSHVPELVGMQGGVYVNAGSWHTDRSYATMDASSIALRRWNGEDISVYAFDAPGNGRSTK